MTTTVKAKASRAPHVGRAMLSLAAAARHGDVCSLKAGDTEHRAVMVTGGGPDVNVRTWSSRVVIRATNAGLVHRRDLGGVRWDRIVAGKP